MFVLSVSRGVGISTFLCPHDTNVIICLSHPPGPGPQSAREVKINLSSVQQSGPGSESVREYCWPSPPSVSLSDSLSWADTLHHHHHSVINQYHDRSCPSFPTITKFLTLFFIVLQVINFLQTTKVQQHTYTGSYYASASSNFNWQNNKQKLVKCENTIKEN